jgi:hypothetical protein
VIQCQDCEFFAPDPMGNPGFRCDPFRNIKEEACLAKWQLMQINQLLSNHEATTAFQRKLAPLQEKMFKMVSREMDDLEEGESWKQGPGEDSGDGDFDETPDWL